jgi:hypothetical protein
MSREYRGIGVAGFWFGGLRGEIFNRGRCSMRGIMFVLAAMVALAATAMGTVRYVPGEYPTIQAGIDAAVDGDTVLVADGTYTRKGNRDIDFLGKAILVASENGPEVTIIDCQGSEPDPHRGFYFHSGEDSTSVLHGFTITRGYVTGDGGAIYCYYSSPTIEGNMITGNSAVAYSGEGAGIYCWYSSPLIKGNIIEMNYASYGGGGICCSGSTSTSTIEANTIAGNTAEDGGGIHCRNLCAPSINGNLIIENIVNDRGGGIFCHHSWPTINCNTIVWNRAYYKGAAISSHESASPTVSNSIIWYNGGKNIHVSIWASISITYSDIYGGWEGEGNIDADPLFVTGPFGDYYLSQAPCQQDLSPCVDAGDPSSSVLGGTTRTDEICDMWPVDMGYHYCPCTPPSLSVVLIPDATIVERGSKLGYTVEVTNDTGKEQKIEYWSDVYLWTGMLYKKNPVFGPKRVKIGTGVSSGHLSHKVPLDTPLKTYTLCGRIGWHPDNIWDEDCFAFTVVE